MSQFHMPVDHLPFGRTGERLTELGTTSFGAVADYAVDVYQRSMIFTDILRKSGKQQAEMCARPVNAVLMFDYQVIMRGTDLPRPVNYALVRVVPPKDTYIDDTKRPVIVIDPRAGQGPGIGGFKPVSEIGQAFSAGHPVYAIGFIAEPVEGQTIEDIAHAHTVFIEKVVELQPKACGKPMIFGNCQAGWHLIMAACLRPDLVGPLCLAGAPLSFWGGVRGINPMRYTGGLLGGTWIARLMSDLGGGIFDGAWLISNFDSLNLANTYWTKPYNVWANPEKEEPRYLEFEKWWGAFVHLRGDELQYMVDNLFVGNKLSTGQIVTKDGIRLDMRNIKTPILCFCSKGDNITPPQQALGWILDNYESVDQIRDQGQTILYCMHETAGHLAIFVGTKVAAKEHSQFINYMDLIDGIPPGLYEIVITEKKEGDAGADLLQGDFNVRIEARTLTDLLEMGGNTLQDEREFATVARVSAINNAIYAALVQPWVRAMVTPQVAQAVLASQPLRLKYAICSDTNPLVRAMTPLAERARENRKPVQSDNPFVKLQEQVSGMVTEWLETVTQVRDQAQEAVFHAIYGSPWVQALVGVDPQSGPPRPKPGTSPDQQAALAARTKQLRENIDKGGPLEATVRAAVYIARAQEAVDARSFEVLRRILKEFSHIDLMRYKAAVREQWSTLNVAEREAINALPKLLPADRAARRKMFELIKSIRSASGPLEGDAKRRLEEIEEIFTGKAAAGEQAAERPIEKQPLAEAQP